MVIYENVNYNSLVPVLQEPFTNNHLGLSAPSKDPTSHSSVPT